MTSDLSAYLWVGPVVGIGLVVGPTLVVSLTYLCKNLVNSMID